jgi:hypothetical protein
LGKSGTDRSQEKITYLPSKSKHNGRDLVYLQKNCDPLAMPFTAAAWATAINQRLKPYLVGSTFDCADALEGHSGSGP